MRNNRAPRSVSGYLIIMFELIDALLRGIELFVQETWLLRRADSLCRQLSIAARKFHHSTEELTVSLWADNADATPANIRERNARVDSGRTIIMQYAFSSALLLGLILIAVAAIRSKLVELDPPIIAVLGAVLLALAAGYRAFAHLEISSLTIPDFGPTNLDWCKNIRILREDLLPALESELSTLRLIETAEQFEDFSTRGMLSQATANQLHRASGVVRMQLEFIGERARRQFEHSEAEAETEAGAEAEAHAQPLAYLVTEPADMITAAGGESAAASDVGTLRHRRPSFDAITIGEPLPPDMHFTLEPPASARPGAASTFTLWVRGDHPSSRRSSLHSPTLLAAGETVSTTRTVAEAAGGAGNALSVLSHG